MKTLLLIDANSLIYRFFHALPPLATPDNKPIQAIYGLTSVLLKILREQKPDYAAAAFDRPEKTFREERFKEYKIHRPPAPDELVGQIKRAPEIFSLFNIRTYDLAGFEADDLIGTLAEYFSKEPDLKIVILSGDLDMLQLVEDNRIVGQIIRSGITDTVLYDESKVHERYGLNPNQLPDYKGLVGDASDNIPGVKGIGPKTTSELLQEFKTLDGIFENLAIIKPQIAKKLEDKKNDAFLSKELATIRKNAPIVLPALQNLKLAECEKNRLAEYFSGLGFESLIKRL